MAENGGTEMAVKLVTREKIAETSSKGNQEKWRDGNLWYKLDQFRYESHTETFTSLLLAHSNIEKDTPFSFVRYEMAQVNVKNTIRTGCISHHFLGEGQSIVTVAHLLKHHYGVPLNHLFEKIPSYKGRIAFLADACKDITRLDFFPQYLTVLFEIDALILNNDRHLNNIAVIEQDGKFDYCPIFDQGAGLLSNTQIFRMDIAPKGLISSVRAQPFDMTFNHLVNSVRNLYGRQLELPKFTRKQLREMLKPLLEYYPERDRGIISDRVIETVIVRQK